MHGLTAAPVDHHAQTTRTPRIPQRMNTAEKKRTPPKKNAVYDVDGSEHAVAQKVLEEIKRDVERRLNAQELEIPSLPTVASKLLQVSNDPAVGMEEIEKLIRADQFLAGKILALVNSAFRGGRQISSLKNAVNLLGLRTLRDLTFSLSLHQKIFKAKRYAELMEGNWTHSVGSALACSLIAERLKTEKESAFLCGLLHDIGCPVLLNSIIQIEESLLEGKEIGVDCVEILVSDFHELVGGYVGKRWNLAPNAIEVIRNHHDPGRSHEHQTLTTIVYCGDKIAEHLGYGREAKECTFTLDRWFHQLGLAEPSTIDEILEATRAQTTAFISTFSH